MVATVRIIGGQWKRSVLTAPEVPGMRPTPDRVRETLFNWLGVSLQGWRVLDAFAGTGSMGWEAASRGASHTVLLDAHPRVVETLQRHRRRLDAGERVHIHRADAIAWLARTARQPGWVAAMGGPFDLVLLDPPYQSPLLNEALGLLGPWLAPDAHVYLESDRPLDDMTGWPAGAPRLTLYRQGRAGQVHYHLFSHDPDRAATTPGA